MDEIVFCPKCAWIGDSYDKWEGKVLNYRICSNCHTPVIGTGIPIEEFPVVGTREYFEYERKIYKEQIEPLGQLDKTLPSYKSFYNQYFGDFEKKFFEEKELMGRRIELEKIIQEDKANVPTCPICHSTKIHKISVTNKVGAAALFGVFSIGHLSKTFKCDSCGAKF